MNKCGKCQLGYFNFYNHQTVRSCHSCVYETEELLLNFCSPALATSRIQSSLSAFAVNLPMLDTLILFL